MNMRIKVLFNDGPPGQSAARNLAIAQCTGEIVAFIDDDALAKRDWLETIVESFSRNKSLIAVGGTALPMWEDGEMSWFPEEFYWIIGCTAWTRWETNRKVSYVWGMNMAVRKEALQTCSFAWGHVASERGIKVGIEGDDAEFITRIARVTNRPVEFEPAMTVYHRVSKSRITLKFIRQKSFWVGYTRAVHNRTHPELGKGNERRLLFRITTRFLPMTLLTLVAKPILSMKRISLAAYSLAYLCLGYLAGSSWTSSYGSLIAAKYTR
jgi:glycosyltransferase involved in cell wall biosynthesis